MARTALTVFVCVTCFSIAGGIAYLFREERPVENPSAPVVAEQPETGPGLPWATDVTPASQSQAEQELAIAVRPRPMSSEEVVSLGAKLRDREQQMKTREDAIEKQQQRLRLIAQDIDAEKREWETLQTTLRERIATAEELLAAIAEQRRTIQEERRQANEELDAIRATQTKYQEHERENLERMSAWFQNMEPATAANYLKELSNDGKMDLAVQLLGKFEERDAAGILEQMNDPQLVIQLTERFRGLQRPEPKKLPR